MGLHWVKQGWVLGCTKNLTHQKEAAKNCLEPYPGLNRSKARASRSQASLARSKEFQRVLSTKTLHHNTRKTRGGGMEFGSCILDPNGSRNLALLPWPDCNHPKTLKPKCDKQRNPLNFRSFKQAVTNRIPSKQCNCRSRAKLEVQSEYSTVRLTAQLRDKARATLRTSGLLLDVAQRTS